MHISIWTQNTHVVKRRAGELVKEITKQAKEEHNNDIFMTVPFNEKILTWKTNK